VGDFGGITKMMNLFMFPIELTYDNYLFIFMILFNLSIYAYYYYYMGF
jgi:hypothetical protein